jgi:uncharacterized protein with PIN domain
MTQDKVKAPNCPECGKFMDKVEATITKQLAEEGTGMVGAEQMVAWVCTPCNQSGKA